MDDAITKQPLYAFVKTYQLLTSVEESLNSLGVESDSVYAAEPAKSKGAPSKALLWRIDRQVEDLEEWLTIDPENETFRTLRHCNVEGRALLGSTRGDIKATESNTESEPSSLRCDNGSATVVDIAHFKSTLDVALISYLFKQNFQLLSSRDGQKVPVLRKLCNLFEVIPRKLLSRLNDLRSFATIDEKQVQLEIKDELDALPHGFLRSMCAELESTPLVTTQERPSHRFLDVRIENQSRVHLGDLHYHSHQSDMSSTGIEVPLLVLSDLIQDAHNRFCDQLLFDAYDSRSLAIAESHSNTFDWIFQDTYVRPEDKQSFLQWLDDQRMDKGIFWIRGKAGSGKSTMMKHLVKWQTKTTTQRGHLQNRKILLASHYFWELGTVLQRSVYGCLRTLMSRLCFQVPDVILATLPADVWRETFLGISDKHHPRWYEDLTRLQNLLLEFLKALVKNHSVLLFVDGLDECSATAEEMLAFLTFLKGLGRMENVKLCLTSRPENIFIQELEIYDHLRVEDLNRNDIRKYAFDKLSAHQQFNALEVHEQASADRIAGIIAAKSSGVFFWVYLAVRDLLDTIRNGGNYHNVLSRLDQMPRELDDFFQQMLHRIQPHLRKESSALLQVMLYLVQDHPGQRYLDTIDIMDISRFVAQANFALEEDYGIENVPEIKNLQHTHHCANMFINSRSMGLLELVKQTLRYRDQVGFLHRTVVEFLATSGAQKILHAYTNGPFDARLWYANSHLARLRCTQHYYAMWKVGFGEDVYSFKRSFHFICNEIRAGCLASKEQSHLTKKVVEKSLSRSIELFYNKEDDYLQLSAHKVLNEDIHNMMKTEYPIGEKFLGLAVVQNEVDYLHKNLNADTLRSKKGLSFLDHILFADSDMCFFDENWRGALKAVLQTGEDPNRPSFHGSSPWLRFILCRTLFSGQNRIMVEQEFLHAVALMLEYGASQSFTLDELRCACKALLLFGAQVDHLGRERLRKIFASNEAEAIDKDPYLPLPDKIHVRELFQEISYLDSEDLEKIEKSLHKSHEAMCERKPSVKVETAQTRNQAILQPVSKRPGTDAQTSKPNLSGDPLAKVKGIRRVIGKAESSVQISGVVVTSKDISKS